MQADRFRLYMRPFAAQAAHPIVLHHFQRLRQRLLFAQSARPVGYAAPKLPSA